jgi:hydrogenase-4 component B
VGLLSQAGATALVLSAALPIVAGGAPLVGELAWAYPVGTLRMRLDALGAFFLAWSLPMTLLGSVYAVGYLRRHFGTERHVGVHYALLNMTALSFVLVYTGDHALVFLLGWEIAALAAWLLVIWDYTNQKVRFAGFNYLVSTHIGLMFLVAAFMILYTHFGVVGTGQLRPLAAAQPGSERNLVFLLLVTSFGLKSAFFPFHSWLPRAHAAAPAHVSALMSGVIHKAGLYALVRFVLLIGTPDEWMGWFLIAFSLLSAVIGALYTVGQRDLKRLLGYSSTENVGIAGIGFGVGCLGLTWGNPLVALGFAGGLLHVLNHAFFKCQLFYAAGAVYQAAHTVDMERLGGLARLMPWTAASFLIGGVAISALPPLNGFASEFVIYSGLFSGQPMRGGRRWRWPSRRRLAFVGAVSALSITRAFGVVFLGAPRDAAIEPPHEVSRWMLAAHAGACRRRGGAGRGAGARAGWWRARCDWRWRPARRRRQRRAARRCRPWARRCRASAWSSGALTLAIGCCGGWRCARGRAARPHHVTWGCGYTAPNPRMQYTGSSFSWDFGRRFRACWCCCAGRRRPKATSRPTLPDHHCPDAVERRLFSVIKHGDESASELSRQLREDDPRSPSPPRWWRWC